jgi:hypothetical protein
MPGKSIKIGPFKKGLNNISQSGECDDDEVVKLINFEVALDTSLTCRPPIEVVNGSLITTAGYSNYQVFGIYRVSNTEWYVIAQYQTGASQWTLAAILNGDPTGTVIVINTFTAAGDKASCYTQWIDTCYFNTSAGAANVGFRWKKGDASVTLNNTSGFVMPHGDILIAWKSRLWTVDTKTAANANTINFSYIDATAGSLAYEWRSNGGAASTDTFPVDQGNGGFITAILPLANSLLIFKSDSTYRFSYASDPAKGQIDRLSDYIGCSNQFSIVNFENYVYILHQGRVYELINNLFIQINKLVYFQSDGDNSCVDSTAATVSMSAVSRRIIVQYNNTMYVYGIDTKTWSQWRSFSGTPGRFYQLPQDPASAAPLMYIAASQGTVQNPSSNYITDVISADARAYLQANSGNFFNVTVDGAGTINVASTASGNTCTLLMNGSGATTNYNVPLGPGLNFSVTGTVAADAGVTVNAVMTYLLRTGATSTQTVALTPGSINAAFQAPAQAIQAYLSFTATGMVNGSNFSVTNPIFTRTNGQSPISMIKLTDHHYSSATSIEYIECVLNTKSYDYQAPANVKRLFWWGIDCVTKRDINTVTIPIAQTLLPSWGDLQNYTHAQLAQGTWGNPLIWRGQQLNVIDSDSLANSMTANGRVFARNLKSLRFRQIQFNVTMTSLGNTTTGPCKIFSLVTYALPHSTESEKVS